LLDYFGVDIPADMQGKSLKDTIAEDKPIRQAALFGIHGGHVNITDGRYVYMRAPVSRTNTPLYNYTLMPTHMKNHFTLQELSDISLQEPFSFTKGVRTLKVKANSCNLSHSFGTLMFDLEHDPRQESPIQDQQIESRMTDLLKQLMAESDAPEEQYIRLGLADADKAASTESGATRFDEHTPLGELLDHPQASAILEKYMPGITSSSMIGMALGFSLKQLSYIPQSNMPKELVMAIAKDLATINRGNE
jgi:hypothetical protein